jgi:hypothetical protein
LFTPQRPATLDQLNALSGDNSVGTGDKSVPYNSGYGTTYDAPVSNGQPTNRTLVPRAAPPVTGFSANNPWHVSPDHPNQ